MKKRNMLRKLARTLLISIKNGNKEKAIFFDHSNGSEMLISDILTYGRKSLAIRPDLKIEIYSDDSTFEEYNLDELEEAVEAFLKEEPVVVEEAIPDIKHKIICDGNWFEIIEIEAPANITFTDLLELAANTICDEDCYADKVENINTPNPSLTIRQSFGKAPICKLIIPSC